MMIAFIPRRFLPVLDRLFRTPLKAGKALLASMVPDGSSFLNRDVPGRTDSAADRTLIALFIRPEFPVHFRNPGVAHFVKEGK